MSDMPTPGASAAPSGADPDTDPPSAASVGGAVDMSMGSVTTPAPTDATGSVTTQASGSPALMGRATAHVQSDDPMGAQLPTEASTDVEMNNAE